MIGITVQIIGITVQIVGITVQIVGISVFFVKIDDLEQLFIFIGIRIPGYMGQSRQVRSYRRSAMDGSSSAVGGNRLAGAVTRFVRLCYGIAPCSYTVRFF